MTAELSKKGVYSNRSGKSVMIAASIQLVAILRDHVTGDLSGEIQFKATDRSKKYAHFPMSAFIGRNQRHIIDSLANKGYRWPKKNADCKAIIELLADANPTEYTAVDTCGWHNDVFLTPSAHFSDTPRALRLCQANHHRAPYILGTGSLARWKKRVATLGQVSLGLRIGICAAFAAPLLKPLCMPAFGINFFGPTSQGKTSLLYGASSVAGLIADGLPTWADSMAATEEMLLGYRDCVLPLDETGDGGGRDVSIEQKVSMLSFSVSRKRMRSRSSAYEQNIGIKTRDYRTIILSTSERALDEVASERIAGTQVRFFDFPAIDGGSVGVFQRPSKHLRSVDPVTAGKAMADNLRSEAEKSQGHALVAFLEKLVADGTAQQKLRISMKAFHGSSIEIDSAALRMKDNFALLYAAGCLAIEYDAVPWKRKALLRDIRRAWEIVRARFTAKKTEARTPAQHVFDALSKLNLINLKDFDGKRSKLSSCDGFLFKGRYYVRGRALPSVCRTYARWLIQNKIQLIEANRKDVTTMAKRLPDIDGKPRYYVFLKRALFDAA